MSDFESQSEEEIKRGSKPKSQRKRRRNREQFQRRQKNQSKNDLKRRRKLCGTRKEKKESFNLFAHSRVKWRQRRRKPGGSVLWFKKRKKTQKNSHLVIHCPMSKGVGEQESK